MHEGVMEMYCTLGMTQFMTSCQSLKIPTFFLLSMCFPSRCTSGKIKPDLFVSCSLLLLKRWQGLSRRCPIYCVVLHFKDASEQGL